MPVRSRRWASKSSTVTSGHFYRPEDLAAFLADSYSVAWHQALLADPSRLVWVADDDGELVGCGIARPCKLPVPALEPRAGEIQRLDLRAEWHGHGNGSRLPEQLLRELQNRGYAPLYVGVWSQNFGAWRLYARYGFRQVGDDWFLVGRHRDHEFILRQGRAGEAAARAVAARA
jgi:ribosomal protein S18 acetylase RimI-like enzyme